MTNLSSRLKKIASLVPNGARVCDIGTDHAFLPIYLIKENIAKTVIACDLNEKPLECAKHNVAQSGLSGIELRLCDGLCGIDKSEVDTIIIAGLGGEVIAGILAKCGWIKDENLTLILQPTTSPDYLRRFLVENGFETIFEPAIFENKKLYSVMVIKYTNKPLSYPEHYYYIGKVDPKTFEGDLYIKKQFKRVSDCMNSLAAIPEKKTEFSAYKSAFSGLEKILTEN